MHHFGLYGLVKLFFLLIIHYKYKILLVYIMNTKDTSNWQLNFNQLTVEGNCRRWLSLIFFLEAPVACFIQLSLSCLTNKATAYITFSTKRICHHCKSTFLIFIFYLMKLRVLSFPLIQHIFAKILLQPRLLWPSIN